MDLIRTLQFDSVPGEGRGGNPILDGGISTLCVRDVAEIVSATGLDAVDWLHDQEFRAWQGMQHPERKDGFLAGRVLAKRMLTAALDPIVCPSELLITSPTGPGKTPRVELFWSGKRLPWQVSLSHSGRYVGAVLFDGAAAVGIDVVDLATVDGTLLKVWMSEDECLGNSGVSPVASWSIKEAAFKSLGDGRAFTPRTFRVEARRGGSSGEYDWTAHGGKTGTARIWTRGECLLALARGGDRTSTQREVAASA